ncbi:MAG: MFS transporter [Gemmatimonadaceae bacterium]
MATTTRSLNPFGALVRHRNFRLFWTGQTISQVGTWMQRVAQGWLALVLSNDPFMVGLVAAAGSLPVLLLSLPAGVLADRVGKLRLVTIMQALFSVQAVALWWFVWSGNITIGWLLILATINGVVQAADVPARQALVIELVGREDLLDAIALNSSGFNLARIIGPSVAAVVIAQFGLAWCFGVNAISYLAVLASLFSIRLPALPYVKSLLNAREGLSEGLRFVRSSPQIALLLWLIGVYSVFGMPYLTLMPVFARDVLGLGASGYGMLLSCVGAGAIVGALSLAGLGWRVGRGRLLTVSMLTFAVALLLTMGMRSPLAAAAMFFVTGFAMILTTAIINGLLQTLSPDEFRGRVMSVYALLFIGFSPAGSVVAGWVARWTGVDVALGGGAVIVLIHASWTFWRHPELRRL